MPTRECEPSGTFYEIDAARVPFVVIRVIRLGQRPDRIVLTINESGCVSVNQQAEGGDLLGGRDVGYVYIKTPLLVEGATKGS